MPIHRCRTGGAPAPHSATSRASRHIRRECARSRSEGHPWFCRSGAARAWLAFEGDCGRGSVVFVAHLAKLARTVAVLEGAALGRAFEVIPLFGVSRADATYVASLVHERSIARRTQE